MMFHGMPLAQFAPYNKDDVHNALKNNPLLACQIVLAVWLLGQTEDEKKAQDAKHVNGVGFDSKDAKFASNLAEQIKEKGVQTAAKKGSDGGMSYKQMKFIFRFAHRYAGQVLPILNREVQQPEPVKASMVKKAAPAPIDFGPIATVPYTAIPKKKTRIRRKKKAVKLGGEGGVVTVEKKSVHDSPRQVWW